MMRQKEIVITDCDHLDIEMETEICRQAGFSLRLCACKTTQDVIEQCKGAAALINQYAPLDETVFAALPELGFVVRYGVGVDNINLTDADKYGVQVCNVPDYGMNEVADQAFALLMALLRKIPGVNQEVHCGCWDYRRAMPIHRFSSLTVGVLGLGRIGRAFAERLQPFGCRVLGCDIRAQDSTFQMPFGVHPVAFKQLLAESDIISVHCNLNEDTKHLFGKAAFRAMKPGAYFINVSRGGIVQEEALQEALQEGRLGGVALDVLETEPIVEHHFLRGDGRVLLSPHIAWYSEESALELKRKCAEEAVAYMQGRPLRYPVNQPEKEAL